MATGSLNFRLQRTGRSRLLEARTLSLRVKQPEKPMQRTARKIVKRAMSLTLQGDYGRAIDLLNDLLIRFPASADLWADRGHIYEFWAASEYYGRRVTRAQRDQIYRQAAR